MIERGVMVTENNRVALFMDVDNVLICAQNAGLPFNLGWIIDRVKQEGTLMLSKAYADWTRHGLQPFLWDFRSHAIEQVQLATTRPQTPQEAKNTADIQLAVDALELVLSQVPPQIVAICSGDRDFVPLVQKLKRYGTRVVGIGVENGVSPVLAHACDSFIYYDGLVPATPEEPVAPMQEIDASSAYSLMRRALDALVGDGKEPVGDAVLTMMQRLDATFDLNRLRTTFKSLALDAQHEGYVRVIERPGSDLLLAVGAEAVIHLEPPQQIQREYDFSTPAAALASYRAILQEQRIPLLPWFQRWDLIGRLFSMFQDAGNRGMTLHEIAEGLRNYAFDQGFRPPVTAVQKFVYCLNFSMCFALASAPKRSAIVAVPDQIYEPLRLAILDKDDARRALERNYVALLLRDRAQLEPQAVVDLLLGDATLEESQAQLYAIELQQVCDELQPPTAIGQAIRTAIGRA